MRRGRLEDPQLLDELVAFETVSFRGEPRQAQGARVGAGEGVSAAGARVAAGAGTELGLRRLNAAGMVINTKSTSAAVSNAAFKRMKQPATPALAPSASHDGGAAAG